MNKILKTVGTIADQVILGGVVKNLQKDDPENGSPKGSLNGKQKTRVIIQTLLNITILLKSFGVEGEFLEVISNILYNLIPGQ